MFHLNVYISNVIKLHSLVEYITMEDCTATYSILSTLSSSLILQHLDQLVTPFNLIFLMYFDRFCQCCTRTGILLWIKTLLRIFTIKNLKKLFFIVGCCDTQFFGFKSHLSMDMCYLSINFVDCIGNVFLIFCTAENKDLLIEKMYDEMYDLHSRRPMNEFYTSEHKTN